MNKYQQINEAISRLRAKIRECEDRKMLNVLQGSLNHTVKKDGIAYELGFEDGIVRIFYEDHHNELMEVVLPTEVAIDFAEMILDVLEELPSGN